jgi:hypothetical protein
LSIVRKSVFPSLPSDFSSGPRLRDPHDGQKQSEPPYSIGEFFVFHRFGDIDIAAEFVALGDLLRIIGRGEHHDRYRPCALVIFYDAKELVAVEHGEVKIQENERRQRVGIGAVIAFFKEEVNGFLSCVELNDAVGNTGAPQVLFDEQCMAGVVFNQ